MLSQQIAGHIPGESHKGSTSIHIIAGHVTHFPTCSITIYQIYISWSTIFWNTYQNVTFFCKHSLHGAFSGVRHCWQNRNVFSMSVIQQVALNHSNFHNFPIRLSFFCPWWDGNPSETVFLWYSSVLSAQISLEWS